MPQFRSRGELQKYLEANTAEVLYKHADVERILAETMRDQVLAVVYAAYTPEEYVRRGDNEGLSDVRNMQVTDVQIDSNGKVRLIFENLTTGNDSMSDEYIVDTIEEGIKQNWDNPNGPWSEPREFVEATRTAIKNNPEQLINAIKSGLKAKGFTVK